MRKIRSMFFCLFLTVILILPVSLGALDFGLITNQYAEYYQQANDEGKLEYKGDVLPRFSGLVGDFGEFIISAGFTYGIKDGLYYVPELLRTEITMRTGGSEFNIGRFYFSDPLGFIAEGLFDGIRFSHNSKAGIFGIGAWYTGFLYKETAGITMTDNDIEIFETVFDYGDFLNTYFAPRRLLASIDWETPSSAKPFSFKTSITGQFDFSDADEKLHTQYFIMKAVIPAKSFLIEFGASLQTAQTVFTNSYQFNMSFAADLGLVWTFPSSFYSSLSLNGHFAGVRIDDFMTVFIPVTTKKYGNVFQPNMSSLSILTLSYAARFNRIIGMDLSASCFARNELEAFTAYPAAKGSKGYVLGTEFFAGFIFSLTSDLQFNIGGGAFLPVLGDAGPNEKLLWRAEMTMILSIL